jgi:glycosyltransferase involved in cell wall biosynthesis
MLTSIIIPTYNRAHLIPRAIRSVVAQSSGDWELIIVDDGSTDNTEMVVAEFLLDKRINYFKKANSGAAESRNVGVEKAKGELITFLDSDDEAESDWLEKMISAFDDKEVAVVCCGIRRFDDSGSLLGTDMPFSLAPMFDNVKGRFTNGGVYLMYRSVFLAIDGFDPHLKSGQHTELSWRLIPYLIKQERKIKNIEEALIRVHIHSGPRIRYNQKAIFEGSTRMLQKHEALFQRDQRKYINTLSVAGVSGVKTKHYAEAKGYFLKALRQKPFRFLLVYRWVVSTIPILRDYVWNHDIKSL